MPVRTVKNRSKKAHKLFRNKNSGPKSHPVNLKWSIIALSLAVLAAGIYHYQNQYRLPPPLPPPPANALYKQANQPIGKRVNDLLDRMTLEEKIGQMTMIDKNSIKKPIDISRYGFGAVLSGAGAKPADNTVEGWLGMVEAIKAQAKQSRLQIPLLYGADAVHGHANVPGATVFPHAIGLGASQDAELIRSVAAATAEELKATGINWNFAPTLDAPEDIRWGRTYETFSSDPRMIARLGAAHVEGTQKSSESKNGSTNVLASAKHFLAAGSMQWLSSKNKNFKIDQGKTPENDERLKKEYLMPFAAAVKSDVASVMVGLNQWGEGRVIDNKYLLTDKLKTELGFSGFVVSDWYGVYEYADTNKYRANIKTINAGLDMAMLPFEYKAFMRDVSKAVKLGEISQARIDDAVRRILYQKFKAGLFDIEPNESNIDTPRYAHNQRLARQAVASSAVLLKNQNNTLPLSQNSGHILVAGSGADNVGRQSGAWTVEWQGIDGNWLPNGVSILKAITKAAYSNAVIEYDKDASFSLSGPKADIGIAVISEEPYAEGWGDNPNPSINAADALAIKRLKSNSKKVVIVIVSGRPLLMGQQIKDADAVVAVWLPGSQGDGIADVLFGKRQFKAKLPLAWPSNLSQLPVKTNGDTADNSKPLFDRGYGLAY